MVSILAVQLETGQAIRFLPEIVLDATELGDLLPLSGAAYAVGAEAQHETGEPHAQPVEQKVHCVQSFTYVFALERRPARERHVIPRPERYEHYRDSQPYTLRIHVHGGEIYGEETGWLQYQVIQRAPSTKGSLWTYRLLIDRELFGRDFPADISMFNWPGVDRACPRTGGSRPHRWTGGDTGGAGHGVGQGSPGRETTMMIMGEGH